MPRVEEPPRHPYGAAVGNLIERLSKLPGVGRKSAERLANYVLDCSDEEANSLAEAIRRVKTVVRPCAICFNLTEAEICSICSDPRRDKHVVCVVEQPRDLLALEAASIFNGVYHVLGGRLAPLSGVGPDDLNIAPLVKRVRSGEVKEILMATNPTLEGDGTALFISNLLANDQVKITRLARGIASGSVLEFANREMLADAIRGRQSF